MTETMEAWSAVKDLTKTEHRGQVERTIFAAPDGGFALVKLTDGATIFGPIDPEEFEAGTVYRFLGRWETNERGPRFRVSAYTIAGHTGQAAIVRYLARTCAGITEATGRKLYAAFGRNAVTVLRDEPDRAVELAGLDPDKAAEASETLYRDASYQEAKIELHGMFSGKGFPGKLIGECVEKWGAKSPERIRKNPFVLLGLAGAGFKRCDKLWSDFNLPANSAKRQVYCAWQLARTDRNGHTWLSAETLDERLRELIPGADSPKAFKLAIRARKLAKYRDADGKLWLAEARRAEAEKRIAVSLARLAKATGEAWPLEDVPTSKAEGDGLPSAHQAERLGGALAGRVGLFLGGPGTGKTHTLAYLLRACVAKFGLDSVAVVAPTGKAANRAGQSLAAAGLSSVKTSTIHRLLGIGRFGQDGDGWGFTANQSNPLPLRVVVVDETSMIPADLMADLLEGLATGTLLLFVGDPYQLPPVGHGAPLRDAITAGLPMGELAEVRRNAGLIVRACQQIKDGAAVEFAERLDLAAIPPANLRFVEAKDESYQVDALRAILGAMRNFDPVWQTQIIVARNKGSAIARRELNDLLQSLLNPEGRTAAGCPFRLGDKVICLRNSKMRVVEPAGGFDDPAMIGEARYYQDVNEEDENGGPPQPVEEFIANGEIGRVVAISKGLAILKFSKLVKVPVGKDNAAEAGDDSPENDSGRGCSFDLGYAITVHKSQGSEWPCVITMVDPNGSGICTREFWYTAISRGSKAALVIGQRAVFDKQRARVATTTRKTFLAEQVREVLQ